MNRVNLVCGTIALLSAAALAGCGPAVGTVSGTVSVDGQPLEKGVISFVPADGKGAPITVDIKGGAYRAEAQVGPKHVQISAPVVTGKRKEYEGPDAPLVEITEESLPPKYNSESELTFEVKRGANTQDWKVERGKKGR